MERMSSIEFAMNNEKAEMGYYLDQARRSVNPVVKVLFETLAHDETEHMRQIRKLHDKLISSGAWPDDLPIDVEGTDVATRIKALHADGKAQTVHDDDDVAALEKAAEAEQKGHLFYKELSATCENPQEKKFFAFLSNIERQHFASIKDSLFYLTDPEAWHEERERAGLDGA